MTTALVTTFDAADMARTYRVTPANWGRTPEQSGDYRAVPDLTDPQIDATIARLRSMLAVARSVGFGQRALFGALLSLADEHPASDTAERAHERAATWAALARGWSADSLADLHPGWTQVRDMLVGLDTRLAPASTRDIRSALVFMRDELAI